MFNPCVARIVGLCIVLIPYVARIVAYITALKLLKILCNRCIKA